MFVPAKIYTKLSLKLLTVALALFVGTIHPVYANSIAYYQHNVSTANGVRDHGGRIYCSSDGAPITKVELLIFDNRSSSTPFYIDNIQYGSVDYTNTGVYKWITVASGTIPCSGTTAAWNFRITGGQTLPTYSNGTFDSVTYSNKPIMVLDRGTSTSNVLTTYSPARLISSAVYFQTPSVSVTVTASSSAGSSSATTTVITPNDDLQNFFYTFWIFMGITFIFSFYGMLLYFRKP